jgi:hypothetical protein
MKAESFGYKNAWLAAKNTSPEAFAEALSLRNVRPCDWTSGLAAAYDDAAGSVFITPAIDGWVLCVGWPLVALADARPPDYGPFASELAATLRTEVQYFATHRVVEAHGWARATPSGLARAYLFVGESGEKVLDIGGQTDEEKALGFAFFDPESVDAGDDGYWERTDLTHAGEEHVMLLAGRWSVDPSTLSDRALEVAEGLRGDFGTSPAVSSPPAGDPGKPWWKVW